ncbi:hypothetical protein [Microbulbifer sp. TYP-18]|uniref:hypothetical protein n=1 Tax=Microbulbifer sp. TYP-18 TaxID=3230024 RepID=UPI0034C5D3AF
MMIFHRLVIAFSISILVLNLSACNEAEVDENKLKQAVASGNEIVKAIELYKEQKNDLPRSLDELVSIKLLQSIPGSGIEGRRFRYVRFNPQEKLDYRVSLGLSRPSIVSDKITELTFRSDGKYEGDKVEVHKTIDGWAVQTVYR